jgi:hypothetical protein
MDRTFKNKTRYTKLDKKPEIHRKCDQAYIDIINGIINQMEYIMKGLVLISKY